MGILKLDVKKYLGASGGCGEASTLRAEMTTPGSCSGGSDAPMVLSR